MRNGLGRFSKSFGRSSNILAFNRGRLMVLPQAMGKSTGLRQKMIMAPRLTAHVRHRTKYLDMPVLESQAFVFTALKEFTGLLAALPADRFAGHLRRHDFSRWIEGVFRDRPLAAHLHQVETAVETDDPRDVADAVAQAIRARYETGPGDMATLAASAPEGQR